MLNFCLFQEFNMCQFEEFSFKLCQEYEEFYFILWCQFDEFCRMDGWITCNFMSFNSILVLSR